MREAKVINEDIRQFYEERANIEDEYSRRLDELSRKSVGRLEIGTLQMSIGVLLQETKTIASSHASIARQLKEDLLRPHARASEVMLEERRKVRSRIAEDGKLIGGRFNITSKTYFAPKYSNKWRLRKLKNAEIKHLRSTARVQRAICTLLVITKRSIPQLCKSFLKLSSYGITNGRVHATLFNDLRKSESTQSKQECGHLPISSH